MTEPKPNGRSRKTELPVLTAAPAPDPEPEPDAIAAVRQVLDGYQQLADRNATLIAQLEHTAVQRDTALAELAEARAVLAAIRQALAGASQPPPPPPAPEVAQ